MSGLPALVERTGATAYLPVGAGVEFQHHALADGDVVKVGNTELQAVATPGRALAHHAYLVTDHRRAGEPCLVLTGDALQRLLALPDHLSLFSAHYSASVCGRGLSGNPSSTIGFTPASPERQAAIVAANRSGRPFVASP